MVQELDLDPKGLAALIAFPAEKWWVKMAGVQRFFPEKWWFSWFRHRKIMGDMADFSVQSICEVSRVHGLVKLQKLMI